MNIIEKGLKKVMSPWLKAKEEKTTAETQGTIADMKRLGVLMNRMTTDTGWMKMKKKIFK